MNNQTERITPAPLSSCERYSCLVLHSNTSDLVPDGQMMGCLKLNQLEISYFSTQDDMVDILNAKWDGKGLSLIWISGASEGQKLNILDYLDGYNTIPQMNQLNQISEERIRKIYRSKQTLSIRIAYKTLFVFIHSELTRRVNYLNEIAPILQDALKHIRQITNQLDDEEKLRKNELIGRTIFEKNPGQDKTNNAYIDDSMDYLLALRYLQDKSIQFARSLFTQECQSLLDCKSCLGKMLAEDVPCKTNKRSLARVSTLDGYVLSSRKKLTQDELPIESIILRNLEQFESKQALEQLDMDKTERFCCRVKPGDKLPRANNVFVPMGDTMESRSTGHVRILRVNNHKSVGLKDADMHKYVMKKGTKLGPVEIATLLSMGHQEVNVIKTPIVGIISTRDELLQDEPPTIESFLEVTGRMLDCQLKEYGLECSYLGIVTCKQREKSELLLRQAIDKCDIIIFTGATSSIARDYINQTLSKFCSDLQMTFPKGVKMMPGKQVSMSTPKHLSTDQRKYIFYLQANPVAAHMSTSMVIIPSIRFGLRNYLNLSLLGTDDHLISVLGKIIQVEIGSISDLDEECSTGVSYCLHGKFGFVRAKFIKTPKHKESGFLVNVTFKQQAARTLSLMDFDCLILVSSSEKPTRFKLGDKCKAVVLDKSLKTK